MMLRTTLLLCALSGCASEDYPDAQPFAVYDCGLCDESAERDRFDAYREPTEACVETLAEMLGDPEHLLVDSAFQLLLWGDAWTFNMVVDQVEEVRFEPLLDASAEFHHGAVLVHDTSRFQGFEGAAALVHEAGHGRPSGRGHVQCPDGERNCDAWLDGAVDTQLQFLRYALEQTSDELAISELHRLEALTAARLLVD